LASGQSFNDGRNNDDPGIVVDKTNVYWTSVMGVMTVPIAGGPIKALAKLTGLPAGIAVDASNVYWGERNLGPPSSGSINKVPLTGGSTVTLATDPSYGPSRLVVDANAVYFTNSVESTVMKVPIAGGTAIPLAMNRKYPYAITVDSSRVYWTDQDDQGRGFIMAVPLNGGTPMVLASGLDPTDAMVLDSDNLFWSSNGGLFTMSVAGGSPVQLQDEVTGTPHINVDASFVYLSGTAVLRVPRVGGPAVQVAASPGGIFDLTGDASNLYWLEASEVKRWPK
jgi:hypothetical protein